MTSLHTNVASSVPDEAARAASEGSTIHRDHEYPHLPADAERGDSRREDGADDLMIVPAPCDTKESLDSTSVRVPSGETVHRAPSPCPSVLLPPAARYPRCPNVTEPVDPGRPPRKGSLVFKRLQREMDPPTPRHYKMMIVCMLSVMFLSGWNDSSTGPLLPTLQKYYHLDYLSVGYIWVCNFVGFLIAGLANVFIVDRFGFGIAAPFAAFVQAIGYALMTTGGPYPLFLTAFILNGFGMGFLDALVSGLTARLPNATTRTFLNYASYSFGAMTSPLVATQFVKSARSNTFFYYAVSLSFGMVNVISLLSIFHLRTAEQILGRDRIQCSPTHVTAVLPAPDGEKQSSTLADHEAPMREADAETPPIRGEYREVACNSAAKMRKMFSSPLLHCLAFYSALYVGGEFTIGGWVATFLQQERGGGVDMGYVVTGHFAGVTLGRLVLIPVANYMGKHNMVVVFTLISIALLVIIWVVPGLILSAVGFSVLGFLVSPFWPILIMVIIDVLPVEIQSGSIGWVASLGCAGSALMPFITASVSNKYGIWILQPLLIAIFSLSLVLWAFVPRPRKWRA